MTFRLCLAAVLVLAPAATGRAQRIIQLNETRIAGQIVQIGRGMIAIKTANGQNWTVRLSDQTKLKVTGTAEPEILASPGTFVRFVASIDKRYSKGQEKVDRLTIFTPSKNVPERMIGVQRATDAAAGGDADPDLPGARPKPRGPQGGDVVPPDPGIGGDPPPGRNARTPRSPAGARRPGGEKAPSENVPVVASYEISGQVVSYKSGHLIVLAQNRYFKPRINVELSDNATIDLDLADLSIAKPGDGISVHGFSAAPGSAEAMEVTVELSKSLGMPGSRLKRAAAKRSSQPGEGVQAPDRSKAKARPGAAEGKEKPAAKAKPAAEEAAAPPAEKPPEPAAPKVKKKEEPKPEDKDEPKDVFDK